jgi:hypothetical protein
VAEVEPEYWTPSTWADDLGSLAILAHQTPRIASDLANMPVSRGAVSSTAFTLFQSQVNPYSQE